MRHQPRLEEEQQHLLLLQRHRHGRLRHGHVPLLQREGPARLHPQPERAGVRQLPGAASSNSHLTWRRRPLSHHAVLLLLQVGTGKLSAAWIGLWKAGNANGEYRCVLW